MRGSGDDVLSCTNCVPVTDSTFMISGQTQRDFSDLFVSKVCIDFKALATLYIFETPVGIRSKSRIRSLGLRAARCWRQERGGTPRRWCGGRLGRGRCWGRRCGGTRATWGAWSTPRVIATVSQHCAWDHSARLWPAESGQPLEAPVLEHGHKVSVLDWCPGQLPGDPTVLTACTRSGHVREWSVPECAHMMLPPPASPPGSPSTPPLAM